jgi:hypothetical protein
MYNLASPEGKKEKRRPASFSQNILIRNKEIGAIMYTTHRKKVKFLSKYSLDRNNTIFLMCRTNYTTNFFVAVFGIAPVYKRLSPAYRHYIKLGRSSQ